MSDVNPAQRRLVDKYLNWATVENRLERFREIAAAFPLDRMRSSSKEPYYCHYMAWRLGTWKDDGCFKRLDQLLGMARTLPNWLNEKSLLTSSDFAEFWSLIWQLQIAEYLSKIGSNVSWGVSGPDLSVEVEGERWFVECYAYRKSFGLMLFIEEVLRGIDPSIHIDYNPCLPLRLPTDRERSVFLHRTLLPFQDAQFIDDARSRSADAHPVVFCQQDSGLVIYLEGSDPEKYVPGVVPNQTGDPQEYLNVSLTEAIRAKRCANSLGTCHPNLLVANFALSIDFQLAISLVGRTGQRLPQIELGPDIDAFSFGVVGIDEPIDRRKLRLVAAVPSVRERLYRIVSAA